MPIPVDDLERFRHAAKPERANQEAARKDRRSSSWFLKGPIPGEWLQIASSLPGRALHVGLALWFQSGLTKSRDVRVSSRTRQKFSTPADAYRRGLRQLELAGLVRVVRGAGRCALVTLLDAPVIEERENAVDGN